jgi:AcrR family transcriptional regulator
MNIVLFSEHGSSIERRTLKEKNLPRKEREQLRRRREILDAASRLFSTRGYAEVSMKEIATEAECAVGTLYRFFESKEAVYAALVEALLDRARVEMAEVLDPALDEAEQLRRWVERKQSLFHENLPLIRLIHEDVHLVGASGREKVGPGIRERHRAGLQRLGGVFASGMARGIFAPIAPPHVLAVALDSLTTTLCFEELELCGSSTAADEPTPPTDPETILRIFFDRLLVTSIDPEP